MKRILAFILVTLAILICLVSCNNDKHVHNFGEWSVTKNATCTDDGVKTRYCDCGEKQSDNIPANGHKAGADVTCTEDQICTVCGDVLKEKNGHFYESVVTAPSCTEEGCTIHTCTVCGDKYTDSAVVAIGHTGGDTVVENNVNPDCENDGSYDNVVYCSVCDVQISRETITVDALGHTEVVDAAIVPYCTNTGLTEGKHCSKCGEVLVAQESIPSTGEHNYEYTANNSNATQVIVTYSCSVCGDTYTKNIIPTDFTITAENRDIIGYSDEVNENLVIPDVFENNGVWYKVVSISYEAFSGCENLTSVSVPDSVTSIGRAAFHGCSSLESMTLPFVGGFASKTSAEYRTLFGYIFGTSNYSGSYSAKQYCSSQIYETYYIPSSLKSITINGGCILYGAFDECTELTNVIIGNNVTSIGDYAFSNCSNLSSVTIGNDVKSIGDGAFWSCSGLTQINFNATAMNDFNTVLDGNHNYVFCGAGKNGDGITVRIGNNVTKIPACIFNPYNSSSYSPKIITVEFEEGSICKSIGIRAFYGCSSLTSIEIPNSITSIGDYAFGDCSSLTSVNISDIAAWCNIRFDNDYANPLYYAKKLYLNGELITKLVIPDGITRIENYAFFNCNDITKVTIPNSLTSIGNYAFYNCSKFFVLTIPDSVTSIGKAAFYGCNTLSYITIGKGITSIGADAFLRTSSGPNREFHISDIAAWCNIIFDVKYANLLSNSEIYLNGERIKNLVIPDSVISIGDYTFAGFDDITNVTIPSSVISIGNCAFYGCDSLISITIPDSVTCIGDRAFYHCSDLKDATIGNGVTTIGDGAFIDCCKLTNITVSEDNANYKSIDGNLYSKDGKTLIQYAIGNPNTSFTIPDGVETIGSYAFSDCKNLTSITIPNGVTSIGESAFSDCKNLTSIMIPNGVTSIGESAFYGCSSLTTITIPDSVTYIGYSAFTGCSSLNYNEYANAYYLGNEDNLYVVLLEAKDTTITSITIHENTKFICNHAFSGCSNLTSVVIGGSVTTIDISAFLRCSSLTDVYYTGTAEDWTKISIGSHNSDLTDATIHYNYVLEE